MITKSVICNAVCCKGNTPKFGPKVTHPPVDLSVGDIRLQIAAEWLHIAQQLLWRAYRKPPSLFRMVPSLTPYDLPFPQNGGSICPQHTRMAIYLQPVVRSTYIFRSRVEFSRTADLRYFRLEQIQYGGRRHLGKMQMVISPQPVVRSTSCLVIGWGFRGRQMALFSIGTNSRWRPPPSWIISNGHISATVHDLLV